MKVKIDAIIVPEDRQRRDFGDIKELALSINQVGLIQPIVVDENLNLIAGERRLRACTSLKLETVEVRKLSDLSSNEKYVIELEENVKRKALTWQEYVDALGKYVKVRREQEPKIEDFELAIELGVSAAKLSRDLTMSKAIEDDPQLANISKAGSAYKTAVRNKQRKAAAALSSLEPKRPGRKVELILGSFIDWAAAYSGPKFDFVHCDFPYGINVDKAGDQLAQEGHVQYEDSPETYEALIKAFGEHMPKFLEVNAHVMFWCATSQMSRTKQLLYKHTGLRCQAVPLIWYKNDGKGVAPDYRFTPRHVYETAFIAYQGKREIYRVKDDVYAGAVDNFYHRNQKPLGMLKHFFEMFIDTHTRVLDPTCGSATSIKAAEALGAAYALGIELTSEIHQAAKENLEL